MSAELRTSIYGRADVDQLDEIHAQHIGRAFFSDDRARQELVVTLMAGLANAIAFFSGSDEARAANVADILKDLPGMVERCHAEVTSMRGKPQ